MECTVRFTRLTEYGVSMASLMAGEADLSPKRNVHKDAHVIDVTRRAPGGVNCMEWLGGDHTSRLRKQHAGL